MAESKKYYWLKLKRDFFKRHDIRIIEEMPNGKDYILFYLKLLLESIDHDGNLRFSDAIPYNEQMLSVVTNTNIDIVRSAMKIFIELNMMDILDDKTIYMTEVDKLIGSETKWAEKKRLYRKKEDNVLELSSPCPTDVRQEIEKDIDTEKEKEIKKKNPKDLIIGFED
jgi:predicted phage replisome organizer